MTCEWRVIAHRATRHTVVDGSDRIGTDLSSTTGQTARSELNCVLVMSRSLLWSAVNVLGYETVAASSSFFIFALPYEAYGGRQLLAVLLLLIVLTYAQALELETEIQRKLLVPPLKNTLASASQGLNLPKMAQLSFTDRQSTWKGTADGTEFAR